MQIGKFKTQSAETIEPMSDIRAMFVGRKGCGKSTSAISLLDSDKTEKKSALVIDIDRRAQSLRGRPRIEVVQFDKKAGFEKLQDFLYECSKMVDKGTFQEQFCVTLFSSTTSLQNFLERDSMNFINASAVEGTKGAQQIGAMTIAGMRNHLYVAKGVEQIILDQLFYLPGHLVVEGHIVNHYNPKNLSPLISFIA